MKRSILLFSLAVLLLSCAKKEKENDHPISFTQDIVELPAPKKTGGMPLMQALSLRQSAREYSSKELSAQTLSNLLWSAYGFNRENMRVVPSANNKQSFDVFAVLEKGIYLYDAKENTLIRKKEGDFRKNTGRQEFVAGAPVNLIFVADLGKTTNRDMALADCGYISQNVYLFCASEGLGTVVRGFFDKDELHKLLDLAEQQEVILTQTVGYK